MRSNCLRSIVLFSLSFGLLAASASFGDVPVAYDVEVLTSDAEEILIPLSADDDGLPDPPGELMWLIDTLPQYGRLFDPNIGEITEVPYLLQNPNHEVLYEPCTYFFEGTDSFEYYVDDTGEEPDGVSNAATVTVQMDRKTTVETGSGTTPNYYLLNTYYQNVRTQVFYYPSELSASGEEMNITDLALNVSAVPGGTLENWSIRMKHTTAASFPMFNAHFDEEGWTTVYVADEPITETGWHRFRLDTPFEYNGTDNLLVEFAFQNSVAYASGYVRTTYSPPIGTGTGRVLTLATNEATGAPSKNNYVPNLQVKSLSPLAPVPLAGDIDMDCRVNLDDLSAMALAWLSQEGDAAYSEACDISEADDNRINLADFAVLAGQWMQDGF